MLDIDSDNPDPPFVVKPGLLRLRAGVDPMRLSQFEAHLDVAAFQIKTEYLIDAGQRSFKPVA
jgi:hypothetical protein